jgi:competence protein ComEC
LLLSQSSWPVWCVDDQSPFRWRQTWRRWPPGLRPATLQTLHLAHPILLHLVSSALVAGFVEAREQREHGDRIVVGVQRFEAASIGSAPERVRVAVRKGTAPAVGSFVEFKAHLSPPLQPLRPGGYEFARDMYFQRIGASGYALVKVKSPPVAQGFWLRYASIIDALREGIDKRIRGVTGGDHGSIASALITGKRCDLGACQRCDVRFKPVICCFVPVRYWTVVQSAQDSGPRIHITSS